MGQSMSLHEARHLGQNEDSQVPSEIGHYCRYNDFGPNAR